MDGTIIDSAYLNYYSYYNAFKEFSDNSKLSDNNYKNVLYLYYCSFFYNADLLRGQRCKHKIIRLVQVIRLIVTEGILHKVYEDITMGVPEKDRIALQKHFHGKNTHTLQENIHNLQHEFFPYEDLVLSYEEWKKEKKGVAFPRLDPLRRQVKGGKEIRCPHFDAAAAAGLPFVPAVAAAFLCGSGKRGIFNRKAEGGMLFAK